jgi:hypothetical protein
MCDFVESSGSSLGLASTPVLRLWRRHCSFSRCQLSPYTADLSTSVTPAAAQFAGLDRTGQWLDIAQAHELEELR